MRAIIVGNEDTERESDAPAKDLEEQMYREQMADLQQQSLIQSCVDQVLKILQKRNFR